MPDAWKRAALRQLQLSDGDLFSQATLQQIDDFFLDQNLTLPPSRTWRNVSANVFSVVDGKKILFGDADALFHRLKRGEPSVQLVREDIALDMTTEEIHDDVHDFMTKVVAMTGSA